MSKIIVDSSVMAFDPGVRIIDEVNSVEEFKELHIWETLADPNFKQEILDWVKDAQVGDFKDFEVYSIFIGN